MRSFLTMLGIIIGIASIIAIVSNDQVNREQIKRRSDRFRKIIQYDQPLFR